MNNILKTLTKSITFVVIVFGISVSVQSIFAAWVDPSSSPPNNNVAPPINSSNVMQSKGAGLILNTNNVSLNGLEVMNGDVKILNGDLNVDNNGDFYVSGRFSGGLGAMSTGGVLDWNDSSNTVSGSGYSLLRGTASNGPGGSEYFHPFNLEYGASKDGAGNITQLAIPYANSSAQSRPIYMRGRYSGSWTSWKEISPASNCLIKDYTLVTNSGTIVSQYCPTGYLITAVQDTNGYLLNMENAPNVGSVVCCK